MPCANKPLPFTTTGKGYKAISTELELPRDTVRNWITAYRRTGRTESVQSTGQFRDNPSFLKREERFAPARKEYETTDASLLSIAKMRISAMTTQAFRR